MKRTQLFGIITWLLPVFILLLTELILRLSGYGNDYPLVIADRFNPNYLTLNEDVSLRYFDSEQFKTTPQYDVFLKEKTRNTFRIVVQGESTALGFPYLHGASFPRMLQHKLQMRYPNWNIEVINTALAATNSYTMVDLRKEILQLKPDLVIISSGHNEYYGALGVGSTQAIAGSPAIVRTYLGLKRMRLVQLIRRLVVHLKKTDSSSGNPSTLMERMVKEKNIPFDSPLFHAGLDQFKKNLSTLLETYANNRIPVFLLNTVSNLSHQAPFLSDSSGGATGSTKNEIGQLLNDGRYYTASQVLGHSLDSLNASLHFWLAQQMLVNNERELARQHFVKAKEYDLLRFRAPEEINSIIQQVSASFQATMLDVVSEFEAHSENSITGSGLLLEHVHPNIKGQSVMAELIFKYMVRERVMKSWETDSNLEAETLFPLVTAADSLFGEMLIIRLKTSWPFRMVPYPGDSLETHFKPKDLVDSLAFDLYRQRINWLSAMTILHNYYSTSKQPDRTLRVAQTLAQEFRHFPEPMLMAGDASIALNKNHLGLFYYKHAYRHTGQYSIAYKVARLSIDTEQFSQATFYLQECKRLEPSAQIESMLQAISAIQRLSVVVQTEPYNISYLEGLAAAYTVLGKTDKAKEYSDRIRAIKG